MIRNAELGLQQVAWSPFAAGRRRIGGRRSHRGPPLALAHVLVKVLRLGAHTLQLDVGEAQAALLLRRAEMVAGAARRTAVVVLLGRVQAATADDVAIGRSPQQLLPEVVATELRVHGPLLVSRRRGRRAGRRFQHHGGNTGSATPPTPVGVVVLLAVLLHLHVQGEQGQCALAIGGRVALGSGARRRRHNH